MSSGFATDGGDGDVSAQVSKGGHNTVRKRRRKSRTQNEPAGDQTDFGYGYISPPPCTKCTDANKERSRNTADLTKSIRSSAEFLVSVREAAADPDASCFGASPRALPNRAVLVFQLRRVR